MLSNERDEANGGRTARPGGVFALGLMIGLTWLLWWTAVLLGLPPLEWPGALLFGAGGIMPALVAIVILVTRHGRAEQRDYWFRIIDPRRISTHWWLAILLLPPLVVTGGVLIGGLITGDRGEFSDLARDLASQPWRLLPVIAVVLIFGPIPEELAWRGYVLNRLQAAYSPVWASLLLGMGWAIWHLPMFFMEGTHQSERGFGTLAFWAFCLAIIGKSFVMTWVHNHTSRSTLAAILFHFTVNCSLVLYERTDAMDVSYTALWIVIAIVVMPFLRARTVQSQK